MDIVAAGNGQHHGCALVAAHQIKFARQRFQHDIFSVDIAAIDAESLLLMTLGGRLKHGGMFVFTRNQSQSVFAQTLINLAFRLGNIDRTVKTAAHMGAQGVVDQSGIGFGNLRQNRQFAKMVHAHFDHGIAVFFF